MRLKYTSVGVRAIKRAVLECAVKDTLWVVVCVEDPWAEREGVCHTSTTNFVATSVPFSYWTLPTFSPSAFVFKIVKLWCSVRVRLSYWDKFYHNSINQDAEGGNGDRTVSYNLATLRAILWIVISIAVIQSSAWCIITDTYNVLVQQYCSKHWSDI